VDAVLGMGLAFVEAILSEGSGYVLAVLVCVSAGMMGVVATSRASYRTDNVL